jgi:isopenicillin N synthase-like dioxygenase
VPTQTIPVLDSTSFSGDEACRRGFADTVGRALSEVGFFALENHGIDAPLIGRAYAAARAFFELPVEVKRRYEDLALQGQRGFTSFGREHAKDHPVPDLKEFWHVGRDLEPGHPLSGVYLKNLWPEQVPDFRSALGELYRRLDDCALRLLEAVSIYIGEEPETVRDTAVDGNTILRIIHYPPVPEDAPAAGMRAAPHEDINLITLLCEATAGGLELLDRRGNWVPIQALPGQIVVDAGDMLQNLTNGLLRSTTHRVTNPGNSRERRFSMPFFVHPRSEVSLAPLPGCIARTGGEARFPSLTAGEYLDQRLREIGLS